MIDTIGFRILISVALVLASVTSHADNCDEPDPVLPEVTVVLKRAMKDQNGTYIAEFEIENWRVKPEIVLQARKTKGVFYVDFPNAYIEFKDLNGRWVALANQAPGTFIAPRDFLKIAINSKAYFRVELFSTEWGNLSGTDFRLILRRTSYPLCIVSNAFRAYPDRAEISRIESLDSKQ